MQSKAKDTQKEEIELSVILRVVGGGRFLDKCLQQLVQQIQGRAIEIIVPFDLTVSGVKSLESKYPTVIFWEMMDVPSDITSPGALHELYDLRTAAGLQIAKGRIFALLEDYGIPDKNWCDQIIAAHKLPYAAIGGCVEHKSKDTLNWAIFFLDFGRYQPPLEEGPVEYLTDVNISYKREALAAIKAVWEKSYNEVRVNWALVRKGMILWRRPQISVWQDRGKLRWREIILERFYWGRIFGKNRTDGLKLRKRLFFIVITPVLPFVLIERIAFKVFSARRNRLEFVTSLPFMLILACFWSLGELAGYLVGSDNW